jgi:hypothetical protein
MSPMRVLGAGCVECETLKDSTLQNDSARGTATPLEPNTNNAWNERNTSTEYNLRIPTTDIPPGGAAMKSARQFRSTTHLATSIAREHLFTKRTVEEIKEAINKDKSIDNTTDDWQRDDYIPPNNAWCLSASRRTSGLKLKRMNFDHFHLVMSCLRNRVYQIMWRKYPWNRLIL